MPRKNDPTGELAREDSRRWYQKNAKRHYENVMAKRKELRAWFDEHKSTLSCTQCGEDHPATLDFHHRDPNEKESNLREV